MKRTGQCDFGFTLVELITVMVLLTILLAIAIPNLLHWRPHMNLRASCEDLYVNMQRARIHAIKDNVDVLFTFTPTATCPGGTYSMVDSDGKSIYQGTVSDRSCLTASTFAAGEGVSSRGLPLVAGGGTLTLRHTDLLSSGDPQYVLTQTVAGAFQMIKGVIP